MCDVPEIRILIFKRKNWSPVWICRFKKHAVLSYDDKKFLLIDIACHFCRIWQVVSPYSSEDAKGLLKAAIRDNNPGIIIK